MIVKANFYTYESFINKNLKSCTWWYDIGNYGLTVKFS